MGQGVNGMKIARKNMKDCLMVYNAAGMKMGSEKVKISRMEQAVVGMRTDS